PPGRRHLSRRFRGLSGPPHTMDDTACRSWGMYGAFGCASDTSAMASGGFWRALVPVWPLAGVHRISIGTIFRASELPADVRNTVRDFHGDTELGRTSA